MYAAAAAGAAAAVEARVPIAAVAAPAYRPGTIMVTAAIVWTPCI
mgnify:CR=1 FL=1